MNRYYSKLRPVSLGTYPKNDNYVTHKNFENRRFIEDINDYAWGYVEYTQPLSKDEIDMYDLIDGNMRMFYSVYIRINNISGKTTAKRYNNKMSTTIPESIEKTGNAYNVFLYWFESEKEADDMVKEYNR